MKKHIAAALLCLALSLVVLDAHVVVTPRESAAGAEQIYTVRVPTEGTVSVDDARARNSGRHACDAGRHRRWVHLRREERRRSHRVDYVEARDQAEGVRALHVHRAQPAAGSAAVESAPDVCRRLDEPLDWRARHERAGVGDDDCAEGRRDDRDSRPTRRTNIRRRWSIAALLYRWLRDLHLYFGLFISPFILLFAASVFYLNHGKLMSRRDPPADTYRDLTIPDGFDRLKGREAVERAKAILPQVGVAGEIGFLRYVPKDRHLIFPVSKAGSEATVDVDLDARTATVKRRSMNLWESLSYLHKMPGPHNVAIRGNWIGTQVVARVRRRHDLSAALHFPERRLSVVGDQGGAQDRTGAARGRRRHILRAHLCRSFMAKTARGLESQAPLLPRPLFPVFPVAVFADRPDAESSAMVHGSVRSARGLVRPGDRTPFGRHTSRADPRSDAPAEPARRSRLAGIAAGRAHRLQRVAGRTARRRCASTSTRSRRTSRNSRTATFTRFRSSTRSAARDSINPRAGATGS